MNYDYLRPNITHGIPIPVILKDVTSGASVKKKSVETVAMCFRINYLKTMAWIKRSKTHPIFGRTEFVVDEDILRGSLSYDKTVMYCYFYDHVEDKYDAVPGALLAAALTGVDNNYIVTSFNKSKHFYKAGYTFAKDKETLDSNLKKITKEKALDNRNEYYSICRVKEKLEPAVKTLNRNGEDFTVDLHDYVRNSDIKFKSLRELAIYTKVIEDRALRAIEKCIDTGQSTLLNGYGIRTSFKLIPWHKYTKMELWCSKKGLALTSNVYKVQVGDKEYFEHKVLKLSKMLGIENAKEMLFKENLDLNVTKAFFNNGKEYRITRVN